MQSNFVSYLPSITAGWQGILNVVPAPAYTCDATGRITYFNSLAVAVWGRTPTLRDSSDRYCGSHQLYLADGSPIRHDQCWMALALREGTAYHGREILIEREDGSSTLGLAHAHPVRNSQGQVIGAVNLVADMSVPPASKPSLPFRCHGGDDRSGAPYLCKYALDVICFRLVTLVASDFRIARLSTIKFGGHNAF